MNTKPTFPSMFLQRLRNEFTQNLKLVLALWITLGIIFWSFYQWWFGAIAETNDSQQIIGALAILGAGAIAFILVIVMFKRDDLRHPQDFWVTRPIRSFTLFGAKLAFAWLVVVLPCGMFMAVMSLFAGVGESAVWYGLEMMMWLGLVTNLLALSCMTHPGNRALLGILSFFGGVIIMSIVIDQFPRHETVKQFAVSREQFGWNLLILLISLNAFFGYQCWNIIRDRHTKQRTLILAALGIIIVPLIAFVPIPGSFTSIGLRPSPASLPKITTGQCDGKYMELGTKYDAKFASMEIELPPLEEMQSGNWEVADTKLHAVGEDNALHEVESGGMINFLLDEFAKPQSKLSLTYSVFDREKGTSRSISSGGRSDSDGIIAKLPRRTMRITGTITMNKIEYRELARGSLDQGFTHREGGIQCSFDPSPRSLGKNASWKAFAPPSAFLHPRSTWGNVRYRIEDPSRPTFDWMNQINGGGSGGGAFFGPYYMSVLRISDEEIATRYDWKRSEERGDFTSVQDWKKKTQIICEVVERVTPWVIPVDLEVEMPDPTKVRELLVKGKL